MLSTNLFLSFRGYPVTDNPENSVTFKKYLFPKGGKTMSFSIRKIGMLEMPKIAMLSTNAPSISIPTFPDGLVTTCRRRSRLIGSSSMRDPFTKQVLQDIASFNNRYLGGILANLFESHPELQEEIA